MAAVACQKSVAAGAVEHGVAGPATWQSLAQRADLCASRGRYDEALELVEEALKLQPGSAQLHFGRGQCFVNQGRLPEALVEFEDLLRLDPSHIGAIRGQAAVLTKLQRWGEAAEALRRALVSQCGTSECRRGDLVSGEVCDVRIELARCLTEYGIELKTAGRGEPSLFAEALDAFEGFAAAHFQLGVEASEGGETAKAVEYYKRAVQLQPGYLEAWNNLGVACRVIGEQEHAREAYSHALQVNPNCVKTRENMAICLLEAGCRSLQAKDWKKASATFKEALVYNSRNADIYFNLGVMYAERLKFERAKVNYELAIHFDASHANAHNNLGVIHRRQGNLETAVHCFEQALKVSPDMNLGNKNLGAVFGIMGKMSEAIKHTRTSLESNPQDAEAYNNLALLYRDQCDIDSCLEHLSVCLKLEPDNAHASSNHLMSLNYSSEKSVDEVFEAHRSWGERLEARVPVHFTSWNSPLPGIGNSRPLRVGYISPDFYTHSVSYFILAPLRFHDPAHVHVTCYSDVAKEDGKTQLFKSLVPRWRTTAGLSDEEVANMIHSDGIDVLVELTGHTGNNRLSMLARKPAPVIVTWMGYPHTTGLSRVDYRISDQIVDPDSAPGKTTEKLAYLPECFLCYTPPDAAPDVDLRPAQDAKGLITFGCFNNLAKVSSLTIRLWARLLREVPESRLLLKSKALGCPEVQDKFRRAFAAVGVGTDRVDLFGLQAHTGSHLQMYNLVDVALDTAPYAGTTTTCEALYMGIPVVTLRGQQLHAQSVGASLLTAIQLEDLVAATEDEYVQKAASLARNTTRLAALRAGLRARMQRSVLCNGPRHTARLEKLYANLAASVAGPAAPADDKLQRDDSAAEEEEEEQDSPQAAEVQ